MVTGQLTDRIRFIIELIELNMTSDSQREEFFAALRDKWCIHCGTDHSERDRPCQCSNDE